MHIPDGFLDTQTWVTLTAVSGIAAVASARKAQKSADEQRIPLMGVMAAFIFAAQMVNFPVAAGTSGHFVGGVLVATVLGPCTGILIMSCVLVIQCLFFQDGGITALGANIFNMGIIGSYGGYYIYRSSIFVLQRFVSSQKAYMASAFLAACISTVLAAAACAVELAVSKVIPLSVSLPALTGVHTIIGLGEGIITLLVIGFILRVRPDLLNEEKI